MNVQWYIYLYIYYKQSTEPSTLIPLYINHKSLIMVGDENQLNAVVTNPYMQNINFSRSLFERFIVFILYNEKQENKIQPIQLNVQYRMHTEISKFPSFYFYGNSIEDYSELINTRNALYHLDINYKPYLWFNVNGNCEIVDDNNSLYNKYEIKAIINHLLGYLYKGGNKLNDKIGIITPYSAQKHQLQYYISITELSKYNIEVETVDGFQGREMEIIILSICRSFPISDNYGFIDDKKRMNVSITRSKCSLWIFGNCEYLKNTINWKQLIDYSVASGYIRRDYENMNLD